MDELKRFMLKDRVAIVVGGSGGIGMRTCVALARVGARVAIVGRSVERLQEARELEGFLGAELHHPWGLGVVGKIHRAVIS